MFDTLPFFINWGGIFLNYKHYIVDEKLLGRGLYGKVYSAFDPEKKKKVAIKRTRNIKASKTEAFIMEHYGYSKYLPKLYSFKVYNNIAYIEMEYIDGTPLGSHFNQTHSKKIGEKKSVQITINILKGLEQLHRSGFTHNDILPKNILIKDDDPKTTKVIDFNLGKKINDDHTISKDIRNASLMCIYLINGVVPEKLSGKEIKNKKLRKVLMKALSTKQKDQYHSAKEFINALLPYR